MAAAAAAKDSAGCHRVEEHDAIAVEHGSSGKTITTGGGGGDDRDVRDMPPWEQHGGVINMPRYLYGANAALLQGSHPGFLITCAYRKHFMRFTHSVVSLSLFLFSGVPKVFVADFFDRSALWKPLGGGKELCSNSTILVLVATHYRQIPCSIAVAASNGNLSKVEGPMGFSIP
jgi:hypothetical protein